MNQMEIIKNELQQHLGKKVILKANRGRKKFVTKYGILKEVYPSLFKVDVKNGTETTTATFTYSDVLTKTVKVTILDDDVNFQDVKKKIS